MANDEVEDQDDTDVFDPGTAPKAKPAVEAGPLYRVFAGSKVAIGRSTGKYWRTIYDAAMKAHEVTLKAHAEALKYYNHNQMEERNIDGIAMFKRGDSSENVILSNLNVLVPAVYSQNPTVTCSTTSENQQDFCDCLSAVINTLMRRKDKLDAKPKIKKQVGIGLLTDFGVLRLDWTKKADSRELAQQELIKLTDELAQAKTQTDVDTAYGKFEALEQTIETFDPAGPTLGNISTGRLIVDPYAESPDGTDGNWMMERTWIRTGTLIARYTQPDPAADEDEQKAQRTLVYKPTHKAVFGQGSGGSRDEGLGMVLDAIGVDDNVADDSGAERRAFLNLYYTECMLVWDKVTRRVFLFHKDDWSWPIWVWDDPLSLSRFYPYFILSFIMGTGSTMKPGETTYYMDQQDEINLINKQIRKIRSTVYNFFFYNSTHVTEKEANKFFDAMNGKTDDGKVKIIGIKGDDNVDISKMLVAFNPPQLQFKELFNKEVIFSSINRMTSVNDALRGEQFKTNTTEDAVQTYQESMRISIGSKVDCVEDSMSDLAQSMAELCIMNLSQTDVADLVGPELAKDWKEMSINVFRSTYNVAIVAGSTEKPNSAFKKKEAIQIAQSVGQFAQGAPGAGMTIMLRALQSAFTDMVIKKEDWEQLKQEIQATMNKGNNAPGAAPPGQAGGGTDPNALLQQAMQLPPADKAEIMAAQQSGQTPQAILALIQQKLQGGQQQPQLQPQPNAGNPGSGAVNGQGPH